MRLKSEAKSGRPRRWITVACAVIVALVLAELSLRGLGLLVATPGDAPGRDGELLVLCVGDSWTHGLQFRSYGEALEEKLNARNPGKVRVVRAGVPGQNSSQGLHRLEALLPHYDPDLLIVLLGNNDHQNLAESEYWKFDDDAESRLSLWSARLRVGLHSLRLFKVTRNVWLTASNRQTPDEFFSVEDVEITPNIRATAVDPVTHDRLLRYNLTRVIEIARGQDVELLFMNYFYFHGYHVNETIVDVATEHRVPLVNNTVSFHERISPEQRGNYLYGGHPTTRGNDFIADNIIEVLERSGSDLLASR